MGDGDVDHAACLTALRDAGYERSVGIEYEGTEDELTGVPRSVEYTRSVIGDTYGSGARPSDFALTLI